MIKTIVVAVDSSEAAHEAAHFAMELAEEQQAELNVLHVTAPPDWSDEGRGAPRHGVSGAEQDAIDEALALAAKHGVEARLELLPEEEGSLTTSSRTRTG